MNSLIALMQRSASGRVVLGFVVLTMVIYFTMLMYTIPQVEQYASGMKLFDLSPTGYSYKYATDLLDTLGDYGRNSYLFLQLPIDFIYPGMFAIAYSLFLTWLYSKSQNRISKLYYLCFVPVLAGFFDYLENICIVSMLTSYPNVSESLVSVSSFMTILKSISTVIFFVLLLLGILLLIKQKIRG